MTVVKKYQIAGIAALAFAVPASSKTPPAVAVPGEMTAADLNDYCSALDGAMVGFCKGFVYGVIEGMTVITDADAKACLPERVSYAAVLEGNTGLKHMLQVELARWPDDRKMPAFAVVAAFLKATYPCKKA
jgi:hypothetical protein